MKAVVTDFGAILVRLIVPDKEGKCADVVMVYATFQEYFDNESTRVWVDLELHDL